MAIKKSELYSSLWKSCDELRGGMDASQYKDYVLVLLFVKYVSDLYAGKDDALIEVPEGGRFADMVALKGNKEIGNKINIIIAKLAEANGLTGVIDGADFNDEEKLGKGKAMVDRLTALVAIFDNPELNFSGNRAQGDDILGGAYEYLMRHFATESGKSKGQFYTPSEVSSIMAKVVGIGSASRPDQTVYDPTCGSGSLLIKAHDEAPVEITVYGQEKDQATYALARMNAILHEIPEAEIWKDDTLTDPYFRDKSGKLKTFDFVVANPPFSNKAWRTGLDPANDPYGRFTYGIPPNKNGDYAFLLHVLTSLKSTGKGAIVMPHGVLFRGNTEAEIRTKLVLQGYIKGIIGLPPNLFYGTGIPACIIVLDKAGAEDRKGIFIIDASQGFLKDGSKNRLRAQDIHKIVDAFNRQLELPGFSRMVPVAEIKDPKNSFNLNIPRYIDSSKPEDLQSIDAHLRGGIPNEDVQALAEYWHVFPSLTKALFKSAGRAGYSLLTVKPEEVKATIFNHPEFTDFNNSISTTFAKWRDTCAPQLKSIAIGDKPKELLTSVSESLLETFLGAPLIDPYDVYQHLLDYWTAAMQDDVYQLAQDGWTACIDGQPNIDLIPKSLIVARYFTKEQQALAQLDTERETTSQQMEEMDSEHGSEDGLLYEAKNDKGKFTKASIAARLKEIKKDNDAADERHILGEFAKVMNLEAALSKKSKDLQRELAAKITEKYSRLPEAEIKSLVVDDKWLVKIAHSVDGELQRVSSTLTFRVRQLALRYAVPLPDLQDSIAAMAAKVENHLKEMGTTWR